MARLAYDQARSAEATAGVLATRIELATRLLTEYRGWAGRPEQRHLEHQLHTQLLAAALELDQVEYELVVLGHEIAPTIGPLCNGLKSAAQTARALLRGTDDRDHGDRAVTCVLAVTNCRDTADRLRGHLAALSALGGPDSQGEPLAFTTGPRRAPVWQP